ncbi:aldose epimerase family protein [Saliniradius amylolyticus]|uniref:aldose epimerase family protein n=1 Tax=Saliniradius amylolyticus TaxID=2183582 RepID=UPI0013A5AB48|nr:aldose epimerase family protein [Saliniradius amylolyticus]
MINPHGMRVTLCPYGARITGISVPFARDNRQMVLGYPEAEAYEDDVYYMGATVGRVANRIRNGRFELNGRTHKLSVNEGNHCLHGGTHGISQRNWQRGEATTSEVNYHYTSPAGEGGFPGCAHIQVKYQLTQNNALIVTLMARVSEACPVSLTNHSYFNLGCESVRQLSLRVAGNEYLVVDKDNVANGKTDCLSNLGQVHSVNATQLALVNEGNGLDHCILLPQEDSTEWLPWAATLEAATNGVAMHVYTDQPALQVYSSAGLGHPFTPFSAVCLEAQGINNSINLSGFCSTIVQPDRPYKRQIAFAFNHCR